MASILKELTQKEFNEIIKQKKNALIEFGAPWCSACKLMEPIVEELSQKYEKIFFAKVDVGKNSGLASRMEVMSLPNIIILNGGKVKDQIIGATTKRAIEEKLNKLK